MFKWRSSIHHSVSKPQQQSHPSPFHVHIHSFYSKIWRQCHQKLVYMKTKCVTKLNSSNFSAIFIWLKIVLELVLCLFFSTYTHSHTWNKQTWVCAYRRKNCCNESQLSSIQIPLISSKCDCKKWTWRRYEQALVLFRQILFIF